jgi:DNA modification methylase
MREVKRVLRDDGVVFCNVGDSYYSNTKGTGGPTKKQASNPGSFYEPIKLNGYGLKPKDLCLIPERLALALQADGWWVRAPIIWHKPNPMPGSQQDRPTIDFEFVWMLTKSARYYFDMEAVKEAAKYGFSQKPGMYERMGINATRTNYGNSISGNGGTRSMRAVWKIPTQSYKGRHFATYPEALALRCLKASTSEKGACPKCGSPWVRVVERPKPPADVFTNTSMPGDGFVSSGAWNGGGRGSGQKLQDWMNEHPSTTLGWQPGCKCGIEETVPCKIYDPFIGSGTSIVAAHRLGLAGFGTDLSMQYLADNARERIAKQRNGYKNGARPGGKR